MSTPLEREVSRTLLMLSNDVHHAYHYDAEFRQIFDTKVRLLIIETENLALAAMTRIIGQEKAANVLSEQLSNPVIVAPLPSDNGGPHSRACGMFCRGHGSACSKDCPTCQGRAQ